MPIETGENRSLESLWKPLLVLTLAAAGLHFFFLFRLNINWDEFRFLAQIYAVQRGEEAAGLNDLNVLLYGWVPHLPFQEAGQVITARIVQFGFLLGAMLLLFRLFGEFLQDEIALAAVFLTLCFSYVLLHGSSFRFDTLCLFFSLASLYTLWRGSSWKSATVAGLALAFSIFVSIKTALWLPTIAGVGIAAIALKGQPGRQAVRMLVFGAVAFVTAAILYLALSLLYGPGTADPSTPDATVVSALSQTAYDMFLLEGFLPRIDYFIRSIAENPGHWLLITIGVIVALRYLFRGDRRTAGILALLLALPLFAVLVYRNAFPYYYVYAIPPAMLAAGLGLDALARRVGGENYELRRLVVALPVLFGMVTSVMLLTFNAEGIQKQKRVLEAVHMMFPEPVHYVGPHGMISSFPRIGPFMSTWGMINYHRRGELAFVEGVRNHEPKFMLLHHISFANVEVTDAEDPRMFTLLPEDKAILDDNFVHHWGPIFIAGKQFETAGQQAPIEFEIVISGPHRVEADTTVDISGELYEPGEIIDLERGFYAVSAPNSEYVVLRWGEDLAHPDFSPPAGGAFDNF